MKNLINAITAENRKQLDNFIHGINQVTDKAVLTAKYSHYYYLLPRGKDISKMSLQAMRAYLIQREEKAVNKQIERDVKRIKTVMNAGKLIEVKVSVEWKRSQMWGSNPTAEAWCSYVDENGNRNSHYAKSGSIGGCGYDKLSTAVADVLNQFNEVLKPLYQQKDKNISSKNNELLGYGSGYGILPNLEGGVGVSCYPHIFEKIGFKFNQIASGKAFDVFTITK
jgi:hypothetical protein